MGVLLVQCDKCGTVFDPEQDTFIFTGFEINETICMECSSSKDDIPLKPNTKLIETLFEKKLDSVVDRIEELEDDGTYDE